MDDASTAKLRGLLESGSQDATPSTSFIESSRLRHYSRSTRLWVLTLSLFGLCANSLMLAVSLKVFFQAAPDRNLGFLWMGPVILMVSLFPPFLFMGIYGFRLHDFLKHRRPEGFLKMMVAQRWMWTVLGIYAGLSIVLIGITLVFLLGSIFAVRI